VLTPEGLTTPCGDWVRLQAPADSSTASALEHAQPSDIVPSPRIVPFRRSHIFAVSAA